MAVSCPAQADGFSVTTASGDIMVFSIMPRRRWQYRLNGSYSRQAILMPEASFHLIIQMLSLLLIET